MAGRQVKGLVRRDPDSVRGGMQEPAGRIYGPAEVPPTGVGLFAARHLGTRGGLSACGEGTREDLLAAFFFGAVEHMNNRKILGLLVKQAGLAIQDPTLMVQKNWTVLCVVTVHLIAALCGHVDFYSRDHTQLLTN